MREDAPGARCVMVHTIRVRTTIGRSSRVASRAPSATVQIGVDARARENMGVFGSLLMHTHDDDDDERDRRPCVCVCEETYYFHFETLAVRTRAFIIRVCEHTAICACF